MLILSGFFLPSSSSSGAGLGTDASTGRITILKGLSFGKKRSKAFIAPSASEASKRIFVRRCSLENFICFISITLR